jgi:hypothetical protein
VAPRAASRRAQRGIALLGLLAVAVMVFAYVLTDRLHAASRFVGLDRDQNARVMAQAKRALIGYMALQAAQAGENNPGHLPCPEAPANFGTTNANEGIEASFCAAPAVGRLPWRTLGIEKLVDAAGEPLWYAVSPGWHRPSSATTLTINADSVGNLALDGVANDAVALIIAPGPAIVAQACGGAPGGAQTRPASGPPSVNNYLECGNSVSNFVTNSPGNTFNDQVLRVTVADVMPTLEAAIAERVQREIAPALLAAAYTSAQYSGIPAGAALYPYPVPFANPTTSSYLGAAGVWVGVDQPPQGLLPFNQINSSCAAPPPCTSLPVTGSVAKVSTGGFGGALVAPANCSSSPTELLCTGQYQKDGIPAVNVRIEMTATFSNVAMGLRTLSANPLSQTLVEARDNGSSGTWLNPSPTLQEVRMNDGSTTPPRGSVTIRFQATLPNIDANGWGTIADYRIRIQLAVISDHYLLNADPNPVTNPLGASTSWFVRNEWYRDTYYVVALPNTADWLPSLGCDSSNCLRFNDNVTRNIRALLVLAGGKLHTQSRPSPLLSNYIEYENADGYVTFENRPMRLDRIAVPALLAPSNDRVVLVDWISPLNSLQAVSVTPLRLVTLP